MEQGSVSTPDVSRGAEAYSLCFTSHRLLWEFNSAIVMSFHGVTDVTCCVDPTLDCSYPLVVSVMSSSLVHYDVLSMLTVQSRLSPVRQHEKQIRHGVSKI